MRLTLSVIVTAKECCEFLVQRKKGTNKQEGGHVHTHLTQVDNAAWISLGVGEYKRHIEERDLPNKTHPASAENADSSRRRAFWRSSLAIVAVAVPKN